jgi:hypothetical protein
MKAIILTGFPIANIKSKRSYNFEVSKKLSHPKNPFKGSKLN